MAGVQVLDRYFLGITCLVTLGYQLFFFLIAFTLQIDKLTDIAGGTNFILLAILTLAMSSARHNARNIVVSVLMILWAARLGGFLLFRILKSSNDHRFNNMRKHFIKFGTFWFLQFLWVWGVSLPVTILNSPGVTQYGQHAFGTGRDIAGIVVFALGFIIESFADVQRYRFRNKHGSDQLPCDSGFWNWSRHPNYFGEIIMHFGIFTIAVSAASTAKGGAYAALYGSILGPIWLIVLLMFISGIPLSERPGAKNRFEKNMHWKEYSDYLNRTSILIPFPPQMYSKMPIFLKRTVFLEFPMYVFNPTKHSDQHHEVEESV